MLLEKLRRDEKVLGFLGVEVSMQMFVAEIIDNTDVHGIGVEIDSGVEFVLSIIELHHVLA